MSKFSIKGLSTDGDNSDKRSKKPSKPSLIFITTFVNKYKTKILVDHGATTTFINKRMLQHMTHLQYIPQTPYSFLLADGVTPFQVVGLVKLSIQFAGLNTQIQAHIARNLCADMILGMDYINSYNLNVNVKEQTISIEHQNRIFTINIDQDYDLPKIPVTTSKSISIPPHSNRSITVSNPISSICSSFTSTHPLLDQNPLTTTHTYLNFQNYCSTITFSNTSSFPKFLSKGSCIGFLVCRSITRFSQFFPPFSQKSFEVTGLSGKTSVLCDLIAAQPIRCKSSDVTGFPGKTSASDDLSAVQPIGNKSHGVSGSSGTIPAFSDLFTAEGFDSGIPKFHNFLRRDHTNFHDCNAQPFCNSIQSSNSIVEEHLRMLVSKIDNKQRQDQIYILLTKFRRTFDTTKHNIAYTPIQHAINTVPHSPPACRPYPQPDKEKAMYKLIQEFLQAFIYHLIYLQVVNI